MFKNGIKIRVFGGPFENYKDFLVLDKTKNGKRKLSTIIYGPNGSGKTTLSKAFYEYSKSEFETFSNIELYDTEDSKLFINDHIFVFNENFIDKNVKFKSGDGLSTIALLGPNAAVEGEIEDVRKDIEYLNNIKSPDLTIYDDKKNPSNPEFTYEKMMTSLRTDWAQRQKEIRGLSRNASVNNQTLQSIINNHGYKCTTKDFTNELDKVKEFYKSSNKEYCGFTFPNHKFLRDFDTIYSLIDEVLEKKIDDDLSKEIFQTIQNFGETRINEINATMNSDANVCPYCFRPLNDEYKLLVLNKIKSIISKEEDIFKEKLESIKIGLYPPIELPKIISENNCSFYRECVNKYNDKVKELNELIDEKKKFIYSSLKYKKIDFSDEIENLVSIINVIQSEIQKHNELIKEIDNKRDILEKMNSHISWLGIKDDYVIYKNQLAQKELDVEFNSNKNSLLSYYQNELNKLFGIKKNSAIAIDEINHSLQHVFWSKTRLFLKYENDNYVVYSKNKRVKLRNLSTGERNVIALAYFFTYINENKDRERMFLDPSIVIIDDPIASVDYSNKTGIYSLIRKNIMNIIDGNQSSRVVLLSHMYDVAYNLHKIVKDCYDDTSSEYEKPIIDCKRIQDFELEDENFGTGLNQYNILLRRVFEYANNDSVNPNEESIGNNLRRVLEMYSSFVFNEDFLKLPSIIEKNNYVDEKYKNYFKDFMFRIFVNNESHTKTMAYAYDEIDHFLTFDEIDKKDVCKKSVLLLYLLTPEHIRYYLASDLSIVEQWKNELDEILN